MTSQSRFHASEEKDLAKRDLASYGVARLRDQMYDAVLTLWRRRNSEGMTQKAIAEAIGRDPGWVSRNLRAPGNWTLKTAGELIQALDGESEIKIFALEDPLENPSNYNAYDGYVVSNNYLSYNTVTSSLYVKTPPIVTTEVGQVPTYRSLSDETA